MTKIGKPNYLTKAKQLSKDETERLLSRMGGKLDRRLEKGKLSQEEALAKQLELEDEQLQEWRKVMHSLKKKEAEKEAKKEEKTKGKAKPPAKAKAPAKPKAPAKAKAPAKPKAKAKAKAKSPAKATTVAKTEPAK
jgi:membrane protein involved in colicin uptake